MDILLRNPRRERNAARGHPLQLPELTRPRADTRELPRPGGTGEDDSIILPNRDVGNTERQRNLKNIQLLVSRVIAVFARQVSQGRQGLQGSVNEAAAQ